ncbi:uncharacterized protein HD556DRAFT_1242527, partial [Suillus plorans]
IVSDASTCRCHLAYLHLDTYRKWCTNNNFASMLPSDVKARKTVATIANAQQTSIDGHVTELPKHTVVVPYTAALFREAAVEWLISTSQPIQAVDHPSFKKMIDVASRATNGVIIPNRKATYCDIMDLFKNQMMKLKERLNVYLY